MPGDGSAVFPARLPGKGGDVLEQLLAGDIGLSLEERVAGLEDDRQRGTQPMLDRVVAEDEGPAEVGLPALEDRPEIAEGDVVLADDPVRRVLPVGLQRVRARADDPLVPVPADPEHVRRQVADRVAGGRFAHPRRDQAALFDGTEQVRRLSLRVQ